MKVKVMRKFRDRYTGAIYNKGDLLEITEERYNEIMSVGKIVYKIAQNDVLNIGEESTNVLSNDGAETPRSDSATPCDGFDVMSVRELKEYADVTHKLTFKAGTKKAEIIETLRRMERG